MRRDCRRPRAAAVAPAPPLGDPRGIPAAPYPNRPISTKAGGKSLDERLVDLADPIVVENADERERVVQGDRVHADLTILARLGAGAQSRA